jgi:hypothetical protein
MINELMFKIFYDLAKYGLIIRTEKNTQKSFGFILDDTLIYFENMSYIYSGTDVKSFFNSPEFKNHVEEHIDDMKLDFEYLGEMLLKYAILGKGISGKLFLQEFFNKLEANLSKIPALRDQLVLRYLKVS